MGFFGFNFYMLYRGVHGYVTIRALSGCACASPSMKTGLPFLISLYLLQATERKPCFKQPINRSEFEPVKVPTKAKGN